MTTRDKIIGLWQIKESKMIRLKDNAIIYPFGQDTVGFLTYCENGYAFTEIMNPNRPLFAKSGLFNGTEAENSAAINGYQSYCSKYEIIDERVYYHILVSVVPNWIGMSWYSDIKFIDDFLTLKTKHVNIAGEEMQSSFIWERV